MSKPFSLQTLLDLSNLREEDAARKLGELLVGERDAHTKLAILQQYQAEYRERFVTMAQSGINRTTWNNYQKFLSQLDEAILQAMQMVTQSQQRTANGKLVWAEKRNQTKAFDTLSMRHHQSEKKAEARRDQKTQDDQAAQVKDGSGNTS